MHGEWTGLQALFSCECPYAYYIHCLVAAVREVIPIHHFFSKLTLTVNVVGSSCKRHDQLRIAQAVEIEKMLSIDELEMGKWLNQIGTIKRA